MNPNEMQEMSPEDAKASLGLATRLSEQFLMPQMMATEGNVPMKQGNPEEMPQGEAIEGETEETPPLDTEALKTEIMGSIKGEIKGIVQEEMSSLRQEIKDALSDED